jgi:glycosyltransferase involved in cell wall biosynthesis
MKISFCLITLNEQAHLQGCLESFAGLADEIVIVDSGSTDRTGDIARQFGARWVHQDWLGYVGQKNKVISLASHPWVFSLDADEVLSPPLREEVASLKKATPTGDVSGFSMPRCVLYEGRWIRHGDWYPDRLVRLFLREHGRFVGGKVHERLELQGNVKPLKGDLYHYSFKDADDHWQRSLKYARLWAETQFESGRTASPLDPYAHAVTRWFRGYVFRAGFLDGRQGWQIASMNAREVFHKYLLLRKMGLESAKASDR